MTNCGRFKSSVVVGAAGNRTEGCDQLSGARKGRMLDKQIGENVEGTGLEIGSGLNGRSRRNKQFDSICGATKNKTSKKNSRR